MLILIADDDPLTADQLAHHCEKAASDVEVIRVENGLDALGVMRQRKVDLLFLDLDMPEMNGQEVLRTMDPELSVIIVTGDPSFALEAFQFNVSGYLVKPITFDRFMPAWNKVFMKAPTTAPSTAEDVFVRSGNELVRVPLKDVLFVKSVSNYVHFVLLDKQVNSLMNLKDLERKLPRTFIRVHRSYIVNLAHVGKLDAHDVLIGGELIPVSDSYRDELMARLDLL